MKKTVFLFSIAGISLFGCNKVAPGGQVDIEGILQKQGITAYQYGNYVVATPATTYVFKSSSINVDPYLGQDVIITAVDTHYRAEAGPELYDIVAIRLK